VKLGKLLNRFNEWAELVNTILTLRINAKEAKDAALMTVCDRMCQLTVTLAGKELEATGEIMDKVLGLLTFYKFAILSLYRAVDYQVLGNKNKAKEELQQIIVEASEVLPEEDKAKIDEMVKELVEAVEEGKELAELVPGFEGALMGVIQRLIHEAHGFSIPR